ncbi:MAG: UDP-N-acetylmuramoyl-tripeptide--D-alanyl-D-alanine ligase [Balneolaceae bacterium]|nr:UDP-N-acetylmuramoyl-tripeptide--D-alanyl-D-alanine ligase [Balneolaceae bacterium]
MNWYLTFIDLLTVAFLLVMARHTFLRSRFFLHIFQLKGYKFNEYRQWCFEHWNERVITPEHVLYNLLILILLWLLSDTVTGSAAVIILSVFGIFWFGRFDYYAEEKRKKPLVLTDRVKRLLVPFVLLSLLLPFAATMASMAGYIPGTGLSFRTPPLQMADIYILAFGWVLADALPPLWIWAAGRIMQPVEERINQGYIRQAREKLAAMPELTVVAITGSYGKTTTKFMLRDLLGERYRVCATPASYNTPMGICKVINNRLEAHDQVLILEMGARYEGNIDELCDIAEPDIAVVTNVGIAHLETFGSQEAIARTKSTVVRRLPAGGVAVLNADDERVRAMGGERDDIRVITAGMEGGDLRAGEVAYGPEGTSFTLVEGEDVEGREQISMRLLGAHNVQNLLLAAAVARHMGLRLKTIAVAARRIEPVEHRLELKKQNGLTVIDDAFNSNPTGARNALEILGSFEGGRRVIITPGMIELGELQEEKNREFGEQIGRAGLDLVILVGEKRTEPIYEGIRSTGFDMEKVKRAGGLFQANEMMQDFAREGDVVLYENDLPDSFDE